MLAAGFPSFVNSFSDANSRFHPCFVKVRLTLLIIKEGPWSIFTIIRCSESDATEFQTNNKRENGDIIYKPSVLHVEVTTNNHSIVSLVHAVQFSFNSSSL